MTSSALTDPVRFLRNSPFPGSWLLQLAPAFVSECRFLFMLRSRIDWLYAREDGFLDDVSSDTYDQMLDAIRALLRRIDSYLVLRVPSTPISRRVEVERARLATAIDALERGYLPGRLPTLESRSAIARDRLASIL